MYDYIRGILTYISSGTIVIECQGLGFSIFASDRWLIELSSQLHREVVVYTYTVVRETEHVLYGFNSRGERECFRMLISFSGVGPKTGLAILNTFSLNKLCSIARAEDVKAIASVPGIGKKTAEKLMVDLKQKLPDLLPLDSQVITSWAPAKPSCMDEGIQALAALGYPKSSAERMIAEAMSELPNNASLAEILPIALKKNLQGLNKN
ncbi:Holliday junction ATP-dependent DNA helicase RuvA,Holliday junction DNA helicase RuvA,Holliday junction DNA helicase RuvA,RuvA N terminal domain [Chlamydia poikilotherma]|uniref:Holliday junction branch migration complex subunit RuvA n=1 Tax=Chlamydia poikilotherma TaxID=1967783 RepID=A0A3B0PRG8_9CHLA|nr:Holliday junction branch migration protein RuvA [Chlamydia poikilotherma]SYX08611.1 Holliday junction ATP-dependent DNA helicase RuvA,Holliday junction DNA helicase RuvA,Holliday junction DNA helicase RuvA,RuvA N terminal domain [Chlamydia poikilotherma]